MVPDFKLTVSSCWTSTVGVDSRAVLFVAVILVTVVHMGDKVGELCYAEYQKYIFKRCLSDLPPWRF